MTNKNSNDDFTPESVITLLDAWKRQGYTHSQRIKLLTLYCGMIKWMTAEGFYPMAFFYEISKYFHASSTSDFVNRIMKAEGFGYIWDAEEHTARHLMAFFSPLRYQPHSKSESGMGNIYHINNMNRENNNITKNDIIYHHIDSKSESGMSEKNETDYDVKAAVEGFIHKICTEEADYKIFVEPLNKRTELMMPELHMVTTEKLPVNMATKRYLGHYLADYFMAQGKNFMNHTYEGQKIWLSRVLDKMPAQRNIARAVNDVRMELNKNRSELRRQHRPLSPYEYQDQASGQRFYDFIDPKDGSQKTEPIPRDAEKRPSATARWNKFTKEWKL